VEVTVFPSVSLVNIAANITAKPTYFFSFNFCAKMLCQSKKHNYVSSFCSYIPGVRHWRGYLIQDVITVFL